MNSSYTDDNKLMEARRAIRDMMLDTPIWPDFENEVRWHWVEGRAGV